MKANLLSGLSIEFDDFAVDWRDPLEDLEKVTACWDLVQNEAASSVCGREALLAFVVGRRAEANREARNPSVRPVVDDVAREIEVRRPKFREQHYDREQNNAQASTVQHAVLPIWS
jgi:hypothetical protein